MSAPPSMASLGTLRRLARERRMFGSSSYLAPVYIGGSSPAAVTATLRDLDILEGEGLVERHPASANLYRITEKGMELAS